MSRLDDAMHKLADELADAGAPMHVETALLAEFDRLGRARRGRYWLASLSAIAASAAVLWFTQHRAPRTVTAPPAVAEAEPERPFVPIPYVLPPAPYERVEVVRMQIPVAALIAAGLSVETADPGAQAEADVLVGQDGRPRAVRLVSISSFN